MKTSRILINAGDGRPSQANLRRATSTLYYALFHALANECANQLVGGPSASRSKHAWKQVYRSLDHQAVRHACESTTIKKFPREIEDFAGFFVAMQLKRQEADYDPFVKFAKSSVLQDILIAESLLASFSKQNKKDLKAFAALVLFKSRRK